MAPTNQVHELWKAREYLQALTRVWTLDTAAGYRTIFSRGLGLDLSSIVFNACHFAVAELGGRLGERTKAESCLNELLARPVPKCLVDHEHLGLNDPWCKHHRKRMILAHLLCARAAVESMSATGMPLATLEAINADLQGYSVEPMPLAFLDDLARQLSGGRRSRGRATESWFPLVSSDGHQEDAQIAKFVLERLPRGTGDVFTAVEQAFVPMDRDFEQVFRHAPQILKQQGLCSPTADVSVRVDRHRCPVPRAHRRAGGEDQLHAGSGRDEQALGPRRSRRSPRPTGHAHLRRPT